MIDRVKAKLRRLAKKAIHNNDNLTAFSPTVVLELLDELERVERRERDEQRVTKDDLSRLQAMIDGLRSVNDTLGDSYRQRAEAAESENKRLRSELGRIAKYTPECRCVDIARAALAVVNDGKS